MDSRIHDLQKPPVRIAETDYERLESLARSSDTTGGALLARELERCRLVPDDPSQAEGPFVRLGATVEYVDLITGRSRRVRLTTPDAADIDEDRLSVLSPVGAALIGLSAGESFSWTGDDGRPRVVTVEKVGFPLRFTPEEGPSS